MEGSLTIGPNSCNGAVSCTKNKGGTPFMKCKTSFSQTWHIHHFSLNAAVTTIGSNSCNKGKNEWVVESSARASAFSQFSFKTQSVLDGACSLVIEGNTYLQLENYSGAGELTKLWSAQTILIKSATATTTIVRSCFPSTFGVLRGSVLNKPVSNFSGKRFVQSLLQL